MQLTCIVSDNSTIYGCAVNITGIHATTIKCIPKNSADSIRELCTDTYNILVYNAYNDDTCSYDDDVIMTDTVNISGSTCIYTTSSIAGNFV